MLMEERTVIMGRISVFFRSPTFQAKAASPIIRRLHVQLYRSRSLPDDLLRNG